MKLSLCTTRGTDSTNLRGGCILVSAIIPKSQYDSRKDPKPQQSELTHDAFQIRSLLLIKYVAHFGFRNCKQQHEALSDQSQWHGPVNDFKYVVACTAAKLSAGNINHVHSNKIAIVLVVLYE